MTEICLALCRMVWVATVLVLLVLSATLSLAAINRCTTTLDLPGDNSSHIGANAALLFLVAAGALTCKLHLLQPVLLACLFS